MSETAEIFQISMASKLPLCGAGWPADMAAIATVGFALMTVHFTSKFMDSTAVAHHRTKIRCSSSYSGGIALKISLLRCKVASGHGCDRYRWPCTNNNTGGYYLEALGAHRDGTVPSKNQGTITVEASIIECVDQK